MEETRLSGAGYYNVGEATVVKDLVKDLPNNVSVGVITPYAGQVKYLREVLAEEVSVRGKLGVTQLILRGAKRRGTLVSMQDKWKSP